MSAVTRALRRITIAASAVILLVAVLLALFGWNWLRAPIERAVQERTGRALHIGGDLSLHWGWPLPRIRARQVQFANPPWTRERQMVQADTVELAVDVAQLLHRQLVLTEVQLTQPVVHLELGTAGRKNWLLDAQQQDENMRVRIGRLTLDQGSLTYDDSALDTHLTASLSTRTSGSETVSGEYVAFEVRGLYKGLATSGAGTGGPMLQLRDESTPYPLTVDASFGRTRVQGTGTITSLLRFAAADIQLAVKGESLAALFPLVGLALPATGPYAAQGHLIHTAGLWRYEAFAGHVGKSDMAGRLQVQMGGDRPVLTATLTSQVLDLADLGPVIGARQGSIQRAVAARPGTARVLPELPFNTSRWNTLDADVSLAARSIRHAAAVPLESLKVQIGLHDRVLTLAPLRFDLAGGRLEGNVILDGRQHPIRAKALLQVRQVMVSKLLPTVALNSSTVGKISGSLDLDGQGDSVRSMLGTANGSVALAVGRGQISRLMMEKAGLHLWEILQLSAAGDQLIRLRCGIAQFRVQHGLMQAGVLLLDTEVTTINGTGSIDLDHERLDLTLQPDTKRTSPLAFRSPIYVRGSLAAPQISVDKGRIAARALGALALATVNPLLLLIPLIDPGPGQTNACSQALRKP